MLIISKIIKIRTVVRHLRYRNLVRTMASDGNADGSIPIKTDIPEEIGYVVDKQPFTSVTEGKAEVLFPSSHDVFYNPVQEFNRDLSVAVLRVFAAEYKKLERLDKKKTEIKKVVTVQKETNPDTLIEKENAEGQSVGKESSDEEIACEDRKSFILPPGVKDDDGIRILEGLAASGLRSIRYAREVGGVKEIVANDISKQALECMKQNIKHNEVEDIVIPSHNDASMVMYQNREPSKRFHAIDIDPYGSPHTFLDGAVQCVVDGGILLVTCTDMAVLCGNSPETCYTKYGALSVKSKACHEIALRIVLQCIESHANRYGRHIVPLLSLSADFYVRVVVKVFSSKVRCKETFSKVSWLYQCVGCETTTMHPLGRVLVNGRSVKYQLSSGPPVTETCSHCGHRHLVGGPLWSAPIHDREFLSTLKASLVQEDFSTFRRIYGILTMMEEELPDVPLYYVVDKLASVAGVTPCRMVQFRSALLNAGYQVSMSHAGKASVKTNAPPYVIWDVVRAWEKLHPVNRAKMSDDRAGKRILEKETRTMISFELHPEANPESRKQELLRFQIKPERNWGPKARAKTSLFHSDQEEKRSRNQGKKRRNQSNDKQSSVKMTKGEGINQMNKSTVCL